MQHNDVYLFDVKKGNVNINVYDDIYVVWWYTENIYRQIEKKISNESE